MAVAVFAQLAGEGAAVALGLLFFLLGVAHGAGDEQDGTIRPFRLLGAGAYVLAGLAVAALFVAMPIAGLTLFLLLSAWHFAHSMPGELPRRLGFAMTAIGGSALWQGAATAAIFAQILGAPYPALWMTALAGLGAAGFVLAAWALGRNWRDPVLWTTLLATILLNPVLAVGFAFAAGHALPIQQGQVQRYGLQAVVSAEGVTTGIAIVGALAIAILVATGQLSLPLAAAFAFGIATPHMLSERLER